MHWRQGPARAELLAMRRPADYVLDQIAEALAETDYATVLVWALVAAFVFGLLMGLIALIGDWRDRKTTVRCRKCWYDLRGTLNEAESSVATCPECGQSLVEAGFWPIGRPRRHRGAVLLSVSSLGIFLVLSPAVLAVYRTVKVATANYPDIILHQPASGEFGRASVGLSGEKWCWRWQDVKRLPTREVSILIDATHQPQRKAMIVWLDSKSLRPTWTFPANVRLQLPDASLTAPSLSKAAANALGVQPDRAFKQEVRQLVEATRRLTRIRTIRIPVSEAQHELLMRIKRETAGYDRIELGPENADMLPHIPHKTRAPLWLFGVICLPALLIWLGGLWLVCRRWLRGEVQCLSGDRSTD